jgi:TolB protein
MDRVSGISEIYLMTADGRSERQLTSDRSFNIHPAWSPDGKRVMYTSTKDSKDRRYDKADNWQTYIIPVNGNGQERLAVEGPVNTYGSWSPDGTKVLLRRKPSSESRISEIYVMNSNGTGLTNLTHNSAYNRYPAWSPDGKLIAFESNLAGHSQILVMNSNGRETRVLANAPGAFSAPRFSSDGRQLFYACELDGEIKVFCVAP